MRSGGLFILCLGVCLCGESARAESGVTVREAWGAPQEAAAQWIITSAAGSDLVGDGGPALSAQIAALGGIAADRAGNVYVSDTIDHRVRKISPNGIITTVVGNGHAGFQGDGGPAVNAVLNQPYGLAVDAFGNLYIADLGNGRVRQVTTDGRIRTVAGGGQRPQSEGGDPLASRIDPRNIALAPDGTLYISDFIGHRVYKVTPQGRIFRVTGTGVAGSDGLGDLASAAQLNSPAGLAVDPSGALYIADSGNKRILRLSGDRIRPVAATPGLGGSPVGLALDAAGTLYVTTRADSGERHVLRMGPAGEMSVLASTSPSTAPGAPPKIDGAVDVTVGLGGDVYVAGLKSVYRIFTQGGLSRIAGDGTYGFLGDGGKALEAHLFFPTAVALDSTGNLFVADEWNRRVRRVTPAGVITTVAGGGSASPVDGVPAIAVALASPSGLAVDPSGNLWVADRDAHRVWKVRRDGAIMAGAGTGKPGTEGDYGPAMSAQLFRPEGLAADSSGNVYIADSYNHRIRKLTPDGFLLPFAGRGVRGYGGDGGLATEAQMNTPMAVAVDSTGAVYVAEYGNQCIRKIDTAGRISTVAGTGARSYGGDGGPATSAFLNYPSGVAVDRSGNVYIADTENHRIRMVTPEGVIRTIAGDGTSGFGGDGGPATEAQLHSPRGLAGDANGNLFVADAVNNRVRKLSPWAAAVDPEPLASLTAVNAASLLPGAVAPGEIILLSGTGLGPDGPLTGKLGAEGALETEVGETKVLFNGKPAPVLYVDAGQVRTQVPYGVSGASKLQVEVVHKGAVRGRATLAVTAVAPGLFTLSQGTGQVLAVHEDGSLNSSSNPADRGAIVTLYATGEGETDPPGTEGRPAAAPARPLAPVSASMSGHPVEVLYAGSAPGLIGVMQVNIRIPGAYTPSGSQPIVLLVGTTPTQPGVTIALK